MGIVEKDGYQADVTPKCRTPLVQPLIRRWPSMLSTTILRPSKVIGNVQYVRNRGQAAASLITRTSSPMSAMNAFKSSTQRIQFVTGLKGLSWVSVIGYSITQCVPCLECFLFFILCPSVPPIFGTLILDEVDVFCM